MHFAPALSLVLGSQFAVTLFTVFFFRWPSVCAKRARIARHLVKSILYGIWIFRNRATFQNGREDYRTIICYVRNDLKQRVFLIVSAFLNLAFAIFGFWTSYNLDAHLNPCNLFVRALFAVSAIRGFP